MSAAGTTLAGRSAAEQLMVDACTISAPDTDGLLNETTGQYTPVAGTQRYAGRCRVKVAATQDSQATAGERIVSLRTYVVSLPMLVTSIKVDDVVRVTGSAMDAALSGTRMRVVDVAKGTHLTARRLICEETTS